MSIHFVSIRDGQMGTLKKNWLRTFHNNEMTQTGLPKQIISVRRSIAHYIHFFKHNKLHITGYKIEPF